MAAKILSTRFIIQEKFLKLFKNAKKKLVLLKMVTTAYLNKNGLKKIIRELDLIFN